MEEGENTKKGKAVGGLFGLLAAGLPAAMAWAHFSMAGFMSLGSVPTTVSILPFLPAVAPAVAGILAAVAIVGAGLLIGRMIGGIFGAAKDQQQAAAMEASQGLGLERGIGGVEPTLSAGVQKEAPAVNNNLPSMDLPRGQETNDPEAPTKSFVKMEDARRAGRNAPNSAITYETAMMR